MRLNVSKTMLSAVFASALMMPCAQAADVETVVSETIRPLMARNGIPGMAVGVVAGATSHVYDYGVASKATGKPVTDATLFEIGSLSKTFTATLAAYAQGQGTLSLSDPVSRNFPALQGSSLDSVSLLNLGTHTSGGMPLQFPDDVTNNDEMVRYFQHWKPTYPPGTMRTYANPSIGLLGLVAAKSMNEEFDPLMERRLFPALGLRHTYLHVPDAEMSEYAQGYTKADAPIRMTPGMLGSEAYGIRTTAADMLQFLKANMNSVSLEEPVQRAVMATHTGYFRVGPMTQDLIWEQYDDPVDLKVLLEGNSAKVGYEANPVIRLDPPVPPHEDALFNKTGSTNGFAAYAVFVPARKIGVVLLANKNYPIEARVSAAYEILNHLVDDATSK